MTQHYDSATVFTSGQAFTVAAKMRMKMKKYKHLKKNL